LLPVSSIHDVSADAFPVEGIERQIDHFARGSRSRPIRQHRVEDLGAKICAVRCRAKALCRPAADPKWWRRLAWVRFTRPATAFSVTACGPASINKARAASSAASRLPLD
jgi:hypothetical protein